MAEAIDLMQLPSWIEWMRGERTFLWPQKRPAHSDACRFCGMDSKTLVGDFSGNNKYLSTENLEFT